MALTLLSGHQSCRPMSQTRTECDSAFHGKHFQVCARRLRRCHNLGGYLAMEHGLQSARLVVCGPAGPAGPTDPLTPKYPSRMQFIHRDHRHTHCVNMGVVLKRYCCLLRVPHSLGDEDHDGARSVERKIANAFRNTVDLAAVRWRRPSRRTGFSAMVGQESSYSLLHHDRSVRTQFLSLRPCAR